MGEKDHPPWLAAILTSVIVVLILVFCGALIAGLITALSKLPWW